MPAPKTYELTRLDANSFEHLVNLIALKVLGSGHASFGPGPDGGRDGFFQGQAPYPSQSEQWKGTWYIQSKFRLPNLSGNPQKWLVTKIGEELNLFQDHASQREWPDVWIVATNIEPSGGNYVLNELFAHYTQ